MNDTLQELASRLREATIGLRSGKLDPDGVLALIEECSRLAGEVASAVDVQVRAALEPLPDLPGQLPLPAAGQ